MLVGVIQTVVVICGTIVSVALLLLALKIYRASPTEYDRLRRASGGIRAVLTGRVAPVADSPEMVTQSISFDRKGGIVPHGQVSDESIRSLLNSSH